MHTSVAVNPLQTEAEGAHLCLMKMEGDAKMYHVLHISQYQHICLKDLELISKNKACGTISKLLHTEHKFSVLCFM